MSATAPDSVAEAEHPFGDVVPRVLVEIPCRFTRGYLEAAFFATNDEDGDPLQDSVDVSDLSPSAWQAVQRDCAAFLATNGALIQACDEAHRPGSPDDTVEEHAGRDFFYTREGHGVGFWDGDWPMKAGEHLSAAANAFGTADLYIGDDGKVYQSGNETFDPAKLPVLATPDVTDFPILYVDEAGIDRFAPGPRR